MHPSDSAALELVGAVRQQLVVPSLSITVQELRQLVAAEPGKVPHLQVLVPGGGVRSAAFRPRQAYHCGTCGAGLQCGLQVKLIAGGRELQVPHDQTLSACSLAYLAV